MKYRLEYVFPTWPLAGQRLDLAIGEAMNHTAGIEGLLEHRVFRVVRVFRAFLRVQVVEVAKKLIEAVVGRQEFIFVTQVVLTKLATGITQGFQQLCQRRIFRLNTLVGTRGAHLGQASANRALPGDEG